MNSKKAVQWIAIAFVAFYLLKDPAGAATTVNNLFGKLGDAGDSLGQFISHLGK